MTKVEQYIKNCTRKCSNEISGWNNGEFKQSYNPWLTPDQARRAVEIAKEEAIKWIEEHAAYYCNANVQNRDKDLIKDFRKFMED